MSGVRCVVRIVGFNGDLGLFEPQLLAGTRRQHLAKRNYSKCGFAGGHQFNALRRHRHIRRRRTDGCRRGDTALAGPFWQGSTAVARLVRHVWTGHRGFDFDVSAHDEVRRFAANGWFAQQDDELQHRRREMLVDTADPTPKDDPPNDRIKSQLLKAEEVAREIQTLSADVFRAKANGFDPKLHNKLKDTQATLQQRIDELEKVDFKTTKLQRAAPPGLELFKASNVFALKLIEAWQPERQMTPEQRKSLLDARSKLTDLQNKWTNAWNQANN